MNIMDLCIGVRAKNCLAMAPGQQPWFDTVEQVIEWLRRHPSMSRLRTMRGVGRVTEGEILACLRASGFPEDLVTELERGVTKEARPSHVTCEACGGRGYRQVSQ